MGFNREKLDSGDVRCIWCGLAVAADIAEANSGFCRRCLERKFRREERNDQNQVCRVAQKKKSKFRHLTPKHKSDPKVHSDYVGGCQLVRSCVFPAIWVYAHLTGEVAVCRQHLMFCEVERGQFFDWPIFGTFCDLTRYRASSLANAGLVPKIDRGGAAKVDGFGMPNSYWDVSEYIQAKPGSEFLARVRKAKSSLVNDVREETVKLLDAIKLIKQCVDPAPAPIWTDVLEECRGLRLGDSTLLQPSGDQKKWRGKLSSMLQISKRTHLSRWSVRTEGSLIRVTKVGQWNLIQMEGRQ